MGSGELPDISQKTSSPFYCPYPGCKRKFASLWRLKVHYRAPPNERGSGKERGHGVELPICPACNEKLEPGKHHNKCKAGRTTNPPSKRVTKSAPTTARAVKQQGPSSTPAKRAKHRSESDGPLANAADTTSGSSFPEGAAFSPRDGDANAADTAEPPAQYMAQPVYACPPAGGPPSASQQSAGFPAFEFNYQSFAARGANSASDNADDAPRDGRPAAGPSANLSAEGAAEVLFGIAKSESESAPDTAPRRSSAHYMLPMGADIAAPMLADVAVTTSLPPQLPSPPPLNRESDGGVGAAALPQMQQRQHRNQEVARQQQQQHQTVEGVPIDTMAGMPIMLPWGGSSLPNGGDMVQMVMTQNGLMQLVQAGDQHYLMPLQTIRASNGEELAVALPPGATFPPQGMPIMMPATAEDAGALNLASPANGLPTSAPPAPAPADMLPVGYAQEPYGCSTAYTHSEAPPPGISEEDFRSAVQLAQAAEVHAS